jgi:dual specificity tyrosine-phosphorylation-regulated kinase 2/3/4
LDFKDPNQRIVAAKLSKNKKFDVDNANVEIKILDKLSQDNLTDNEGKDCLVEYIDSFKFRQHVVIIFECLSYNLYKYQKMNKRFNPVFDQ